MRLQILSESVVVAQKLLIKVPSSLYCRSPPYKAKLVVVNVVVSFSATKPVRELAPVDVSIYNV